MIEIYYISKFILKFIPRQVNDKVKSVPSRLRITRIRLSQERNNSRGLARVRGDNSLRNWV